MKQADLGLNLTTKRTRKREFLAEMERVAVLVAEMAATSSLNTQAQEMASAVAVFKLATGGDAAAVGRPAKPMASPVVAKGTPHNVDAHPKKPATRSAVSHKLSALPKLAQPRPLNAASGKKDDGCSSFRARLQPAAHAVQPPRHRDDELGSRRSFAQRTEENPLAGRCTAMP